VDHSKDDLGITEQHQWLRTGGLTQGIGVRRPDHDGHVGNGVAVRSCGGDGETSTHHGRRRTDIDGTQGLRAHLRSAGTSVGAWSNLRDPRIAASLAGAGLDWVCVDQQHGWNAGHDCTDLVAAIRSAGAHALVRVSWNRPEEIGRVLDSGAEGVIVPMVSSAEEAKAAVAAVRYAPEGRRSWGAVRTPYTSAPSDATAANAATACLVMVESVDAVHRVDAIAAVDGVDGVFLGPFDLSLALGIPLADLLADRDDASPLRRVVAACREHGVVAAAYAGSFDRAELLREHGFTVLAVSSDDGLVAEASAALAARARSLGPTAAG
jgi:4-hydroxy-2-oxoheptanedioate aldolase